MIGLDTNILARYIVQDDPVQSSVAAKFIESECTSETPGFINNIVLVELVWVLERGYRYDKSDIVSVLWQLINTTELRLENFKLVRQAVKDYHDGSAGFADCLLAIINQHYACHMTYTFDRNAAKNPAFKLLSDALDG